MPGAAYEPQQRDCLAITETKNETHMKYPINNARLAGLTLSIILLAGTIAGAVAANTTTGKGGATQLMNVPAQTSTAARAMSCPQCKDQYVTRQDLSARGAIKPTVVIQRHLCPGCSTTLTTAGSG